MQTLDNNSYRPASDRYELPENWFRRCGRSGLLLPAISLGCWHNFGNPQASEADHHQHCRRLLWTAFDLGITHFDLANNYGPPPGSAAARVGRILREDLADYRDELVISTKAGYRMWPGPYGEWGSRKNLVASCDQSLRRLDLEYVDVFYHHRPDPLTPLEETLGALNSLVRAGKALYVGLSNYSPEGTRQALQICDREGFARPIVHQPSYSLLNRQPETSGLIAACDELGLGMVVFSPLAQGILTEKYLGGIPARSRAASDSIFLQPERLTPHLLERIQSLADLARERGQSLAQLALQWVLRDTRVTSALIGASQPQQIRDCVQSVLGSFPPLEAAMLPRIEAVLASL